MVASFALLAGRAPAQAATGGGAPPVPIAPGISAPWHDRGPGELRPAAARRDDDAVGRRDADLTDVAFAWAFWRDAMRPPRAPAPALDTVRLGEALLAAARAPDAELRWQAVWAAARIARDDAALALSLRAQVLGDRLVDGGDRTAEVALVALGLAAHDDGDALTTLAHVAGDREAAARVRAFAFYGLALAADHGARAVTQMRVLAAVERALLEAAPTPSEVRVAALHALALTRRDVAPDLIGPALGLLEHAWREWSRDDDLDVRAHVPAAVAALLSPGDGQAATWRDRFVAIAESARPPSTALQRACVLALAATCPPWRELRAPDAQAARALAAAVEALPDHQARCWALVALGRIGGAAARATLERELEGPALQRPWVALGLALLARGDAAAAPAIAALLAQTAAATRHPRWRASLELASEVARGAPGPDPAADFAARYGVPLPGDGELPDRLALLRSVLVDPGAAAVDRRLAALAIGHLADRGPRHWSTRLAAAIDYRGATTILVGAPTGVLRLP